MEEYKNLHEIIQLSEEEFENPDVGVHATLDKADLRELRNLLAKNEELEKMVDLMAENIYNTSDTLNMLNMGKEINYDLEKLFNGIDDEEAIKIITDYFRKKAKGE